MKYLFYIAIIITGFNTAQAQISTPSYPQLGCYNGVPCPQGLECEPTVGNIANRYTFNDPGRCLTPEDAAIARYNMTLMGNTQRRLPEPADIQTEEPNSLNPHRNIFSWLSSFYTTPTNTVKHQCEDPARQNNCTLPNGQRGHCVGVIGKNKSCQPWAYARAPQTTPTAPTIAYVPAVPLTFAVPCNTETKPNTTKPTRPSGNICAYPESCNKGGYGKTLGSPQCQQDMANIDLSKC